MTDEPGGEAPPLDVPLASGVAPAGKVRLFIGQDIVSIRDYAGAVDQPPGIVTYTSLGRLEGLDTEQDNGGGPVHLDALAADFPDAPIAVGLYLVDDLPAINSGERDGAIAELGRKLQSYGVPVLLRVGYEFDAGWAAYEPGAYRDAFVRIADGIRAEGAVNVEFVWQSAAYCDNTYAGYPRIDWYPGDDYVDWVSASLFDQMSCDFRPLEQLIGIAREHQKPFFIAEATPKGYDLEEGTYSRDGYDRAPRTADEIYDEWFVPYFSFIHGHLDVLRGATYINADWDSQWMWDEPYDGGYWGDSRVQANDQILARWRDELTDPIWVEQ